MPVAQYTVDLVWASSSLHHMADPDRVLTEVFGTLRPGGLLAVTEMGSSPRSPPARVGRPRPPRTRGALPCRPGRDTGRPYAASRLRLGVTPEQGRLHRRGRA